jgi:hypothetical protein
MAGGNASFENGQISVSEDSGDQRVLAAFQDGPNIAVDWFVSMDNPIPRAGTFSRARNGTNCMTKGSSTDSNAMVRSEWSSP